MTLQEVGLINPNMLEKFKRESEADGFYMCFNYKNAIVWYDDQETSAVFTREDILANDYIVVTSSTAL